MKKALFVLFLLFTFAAVAQEKGTIKGVLQDENGFIEFAGLLLKSNVDSAVVKTALSEAEGTFEFIGVPYGQYFIEVTHVGYANYQTPVFSFQEPDYQLSPINLTLEANELATAVVTDRRPFVERKIDRTVVNVEGSLLATGGSAVDALNISPGLIVNADGNISLSGKDGVLVYIDGRRTHLAGSDLVLFLQNLSAEELYQIEIMPNPPASYDATGNAGVINIKTKKRNLKGYSGSVSFTVRPSEFYQYSPSANFNYRRGQVNLFGSLNYSRSKSYDDTYELRNIRSFETNELRTILDQNDFTVSNSTNIYTKIGLDYYLSEKTTLGIVSQFSRLNLDVQSDIETTLSSPEGVVNQTLLADSRIDYHGNDYNFNLDLQHKFDSTEHSLSLNLGYVVYLDSQDNFFDNDFYAGLPDPNEPPAFTEFSKIFWPEKYSVYGGRLDYFLPFGQGQHTFELGAKSSYVEMDILLDFFDQDLNSGAFVKNDALSNHFLYSELTNALYTNFKFKISPQLSAQSGLRMEHNTAKGEQLADNKNFTRIKLQLFPTFYVSYKINPNHELQASYGRRIRRPDYESVNPYRLYQNEFTYSEGNINLLPQISENYELNYLGLNNVLASSVYYNSIDGVIMRVLSQDVESNESFRRPENIAKSSVLGFDANADIKISDALTVTLYGNVYEKSTSGTVNDKPFSIKGTIFDTKIIGRVNLKNDWAFTLGGYYTSKYINATYIREPYGKISCSIRKKFFDGKLSASLLAADWFQWNDITDSSRFQNVDVYREIDWQSRYLRLTLNYKFRQGQGASEKSKKMSNQEEINRI